MVLVLYNYLLLNTVLVPPYWSLPTNYLQQGRYKRQLVSVRGCWSWCVSHVDVWKSINEGYLLHRCFKCKAQDGQTDAQCGEMGKT